MATAGLRSASVTIGLTDAESGVATLSVGDIWDVNETGLRGRELPLSDPKLGNKEPRSVTSFRNILLILSKDGEEC